MSYTPNIPNKTSTDNSSTTPLNNGIAFTGTWEDVSKYPSVVLAIKTDQNGTFSVQFSPDGTNQDSTLTRYYRTDQIEAPHRFTVTRQFMRVVFTNDSGTNQTYLRLQTTIGVFSELNSPTDSTLSQDFDATVVRPTDYNSEVATERRQGHTLWNKFGYNEDVDTAAPEVVASWGGAFDPMTTARTLSIVSTDANDDDGGTGANNVVVTGVDANREEQVVQVIMDGTTPVVTTETWLGVNRIAVGLAGSSKENEGAITATATTDLTIQGQIPIGQGTTQQCIFFTAVSHRAIVEWITLNVIREGAGTEPVVTVKGWVYSAISNSKYEVVRENIDVDLNNSFTLNPPLPFPIGESSCFWLEATTDRNDTEVSGRFSLIQVRDPDSAGA